LPNSLHWPTRSAPSTWARAFPTSPRRISSRTAAQQAIAADLNQYARSAGHPRLVNALAALYSPLFGRRFNPLTEIVVTVGATEGIFATVQALVNPGDEVILIEPFYDSYPAVVTMAGGTAVYVPLRAPAGARSAAEWRLDLDELAAAFTPRTKLLILNTPLNPLGKVYTLDELSAIAELAQQHDIAVLSDEVYEWMVYPTAQRPVEHVRMATLPGMWERTVTLGSAGKSFSVTGWKIGWAIAPPPLAHALTMAHQWIPFAVATPLQEAVAVPRWNRCGTRLLRRAAHHVPGQARPAAQCAGRCGADAHDARRLLFHRGGHQQAAGAGGAGRTPRRSRLPLVHAGDRRGGHPAQPLLQRRAPGTDRQPGAFHLLQDG
jgi:histidinol-phosphate/aromatic aminotransferase/cobyric acid decarboxylase-like protein